MYNSSLERGKYYLQDDVNLMLRLGHLPIKKIIFVKLSLLFFMAAIRILFLGIQFLGLLHHRIRCHYVGHACHHDSIHHSCYHKGRESCIQ